MNEKNFVRKGYRKLSYYSRSECVHFVTHGHFLSRDKDGGHTHTIRSAISENPMHTRKPHVCTGYANMNFLVKVFEGYHLTYGETDIQTRPKLCTTPLRGWSKLPSNLRTTIR